MIADGNFCRDLYRALTIAAQAGRYRKTGAVPPVGGTHIMRINGPNGTALATKPAGARRAAGGTFALGEADGARQSAPAGSLRAISTVDALLALQGIEDTTQRRKRAVAKGRHALDALDSLKVGLLDGSIDRSTLARLKVAAEGLTEETGDARLNSVLHEIDLRLAVELAKAGAA
jgi:hypothetical protein